MTPRILITGVDGFIGSATAIRAIAEGLDVTGLGRRSSNAFLTARGAHYMTADITDRNELHQRLGDSKFEYVINLAGSINHAGLSGGGREVIATHFEGTINLIESCGHEGLKGFLQVGSSDEYGGADAPQTERRREQPISCYSLAKTASTHLVQMLACSEGFPGKVARLFLVYGPGQSNQRFIPQVIQGCLEDREFAVSAGQQLRDFSYIDDVADGLLALVQHPASNGEVLNIASGNAISVKSVIELVRHIIGQGAPLFGEIAYRPGESMALYADTSRMTSFTGWKPKVSLDQGLAHTIDYYRRQVVA